jgi:hypothetical protein
MLQFTEDIDFLIGSHRRPVGNHALIAKRRLAVDALAVFDFMGYVPAQTLVPLSLYHPSVKVRQEVRAVICRDSADCFAPLDPRWIHFYFLKVHR